MERTMSEQEIIKKAYDEAENSLNEERTKEIKKVILATLKRIEEIDTQIKELQEEKKILKADVEDFKVGRLDRIEERQKANPKAKQVSVVKIEREIHHHHYDRWWQEPYRITWIKMAPCYPNEVWCGSTCDAVATTSFTTSGSAFQFNTCGTYNLDNKTVYLQ